MSGVRCMRFFRFPFPPFVSSVLSHYQIAPGQLVPNSWLILLSIERLPEVFGTGIDLEEFRSLYFLRELPSHRGRVQIYCRNIDRALITDCTVNHRRWKEAYCFFHGDEMFTPGAPRFPTSWNELGTLAGYSRSLGCVSW